MFVLTVSLALQGLRENRTPEFASNTFAREVLPFLVKRVGREEMDVCFESCEKQRRGASLDYRQAVFNGEPDQLAVRIQP